VAEWSPDADNKSDWDNDVLYCGYRYDTETGLCEVRNRYYDPLTGTWKTRDRILYPDGMNLYEYVRSKPAALADWSGSKAAPPSSQPAPPGQDSTLAQWRDYGQAMQTWLEPNRNQWKTDAKTAIIKNICDIPKCLKGTCTKEKCQTQAETIAGKYVDMFLQNAYSKDSFGMLTMEVGGIAPNPYDTMELKAGWLCYHWQGLTEAAVKSALNRDTDCFDIVLAGWMNNAVLAHNWVTLRGCSNAKIVNTRKGFQNECTVRLDPWKTTMPIVYVSDDTTHNLYNWNTKKIDYQFFDTIGLVRTRQIRTTGIYEMFPYVSAGEELMADGTVRPDDAQYVRNVLTRDPKAMVWP
jgi:RHS repeat-associated protein